MLLVDDIVLFPFKSILNVFREIYNAAVQELKQEGDQLRLELSQLYLSLESGAIDEAAFDERERVVLDRLDALEARDSEEEEDMDEADASADEDTPDDDDVQESGSQHDDEEEEDDEDAGFWESMPDGDS